MTGSVAPSDASDSPAAVLIATPYVTPRGMNRNTVIIDGTKPGSPRCGSNASDQNFGPSDSSGGELGLNGIEVYGPTACPCRT